MNFLNSSSNFICIHQKCGNTNFSHKEKNKEWQGSRRVSSCKVTHQYSVWHKLTLVPWTLNRGQLCYLHLPMHEHCSRHGRGEELWLSSALEVQCLVPAFPFGSPGMLSTNLLRAWNVSCVYPDFKCFFLHVFLSPCLLVIFLLLSYQHFSRGLMLPALYALIFCF